jgi:hypothetical protein
MGLGTIIESALEAVRAATESLQVQVSHEAWTGQGGTGDPDYADPVSRPALVQEGKRQQQTHDGRLMTTKAVVLFFPPSEGEPPPAIGPLDRITLPSGLTGPILEIRETLVAPTSQAFVRAVWLG